MRAVIASGSGGPEVLSIVERPDPVPGPGEVVLDVAAAGLNRADLLQRMGFYPPPPGASDVLGMECSGTVSAAGPDVDGWSVGDRACALLAAGGYASRVAVPAGQVMPIPRRRRPGHGGRAPRGGPARSGRSYSRSSAPEAGRGDDLASEEPRIRTAASSVAPGIKAPRPRVVAEKLVLCALERRRRDHHRDEDFAEVAREATDGHGADVILDNMGAKYLARNLDALAIEGRLVVIGMQGGSKAELDLATLLRKRGP